MNEGNALGVISAFLGVFNHARPYTFMMKYFILVAVALVLSSCTTAPVAPPPNTLPQISEPVPSQPVEDVENVDYDGLQNFLKLKRGYNRLGYAEKKFNTCEVGYGYSSTHRCRPQTFVVIHFKLMCRDTEGTVSEAVTAADLRPIGLQNVKWTLKNAAGRLMTDSEGYGQIAMVSSISQREQRLKLTVRNDFLYLKAGELTEMITPKSWCP